VLVQGGSESQLERRSRRELCNEDPNFRTAPAPGWVTFSSRSYRGEKVPAHYESGTLDSDRYKKTSACIDYRMKTAQVKCPERVIKSDQRSRCRVLEALTSDDTKYSLVLLPLLLARDLLSARRDRFPGGRDPFLQIIWSRTGGGPVRHRTEQGGQGVVRDEPERCSCRLHRREVPACAIVRGGWRGKQLSTRELDKGAIVRVSLSRACTRFVSGWKQQCHSTAGRRGERGSRLVVGVAGRRRHRR
jgi:hypothetical protein